MLSHYADKKMLLVYREKFNQRFQEDGESCKDYFDSLRNLARMCDYSAEFYKQQMYDRSIAGLSNEIWKANLSMKDRGKFTHMQIQEFALQYEEHKQQSEKLRSGNDGENTSATTVGSVNSSFHKSGKGRYNKKFDRHKNKSYQNSSKPMCNKSHKDQHSPNDCWFKN